MSQPRFENLSRTLLHAGLAPRHVRRYVAELRDHFDDLLREELSKGSPRDIAEAAAVERLGHESDLAEVALNHPELRSLTARYPWAVFGLGPVAMLFAALASTLLVEFVTFTLVSLAHMNVAHRPPPGWAMSIVAAWNAVPTLVAPLATAGLLCWIGVRRQVSTGWILVSVLSCLLGGFQQLTFADNGLHGELSLASGLFPPFPRALLVNGIWRAAGDLTLLGAVWWLASRRQNGSAHAPVLSKG